MLSDIGIWLVFVTCGCALFTLILIIWSVSFNNNWKYLIFILATKNGILSLFFIWAVVSVLPVSSFSLFHLIGIEIVTFSIGSVSFHITKNQQMILPTFANLSFSISILNAYKNKIKNSEQDTEAKAFFCFRPAIQVLVPIVEKLLNSTIISQVCDFKESLETRIIKAYSIADLQALIEKARDQHQERNILQTRPSKNTPYKDLARRFLNSCFVSELRQKKLFRRSLKRYGDLTTIYQFHSLIDNDNNVIQFVCHNRTNCFRGVSLIFSEAEQEKISVGDLLLDTQNQNFSIRHIFKLVESNQYLVGLQKEDVP